MYPEVERLVRDKLGASRVFVFDHNVPSPFASPWSAYLLQINAMTREFLRTEGSSRRRHGG